MSIEAMKQALEALDSDNPDIQLRAATALRAAIEQAEKQELTCVCGAVTVNKPITTEEWVGWIKETWDAAQRAAWAEKPPQRQWVGLTEIEICDIEADELTSASSETFSFARAIEAKLKEKNT